MKKFYKIENGKAQVGQGTFVPDGFTVYEDEPQELQEALEVERLEQELQAKITEAKQYLASTAWYIERLNDPSSGKAIPEEVILKRTEARELINQLELELKGGE